MYHAREKFLSATAEWMNLHVDLETRRVAPWPESVLRALSELSGGQQAATAPQEAGKQMKVTKPIWSMQAHDAG
jgi:acyl-CoA thioester hydrolase